MALINADLHIHLGRTSTGKPVKITASPQLTIENILEVAKYQKGLHLVGLVDAACTGVLSDLKSLMTNGSLLPVSDGGYSWRGLTVFLGSEVEIGHSETRKEAHFLAFFPTFEALNSYTASISPWLTNPSLSTQRLKLSGDAWLEIVEKHNGIALAAHAFTPHKGVYGNCVSKLQEMFSDPGKIKGLELGLSANTEMALGISDTHSYPYISNSDAHSLSTIAREFTVYNLPTVNFKEWIKALHPPNSGLVATHGLEPLLGKYYRSFCVNCQMLAQDEKPIFVCPQCGTQMVSGVWDRIAAISDWRSPLPTRPPYRAHVPLIMLPGVGPKTYKRMIEELGTEIDILYKISLEEITELVGSALSKQISLVRAGSLPILPGGGGKYGRVTKVMER